MSAPPPPPSLTGLATVLAGAAMTAIVGNYLLQHWQRRNWFEQQRQLLHQQELAELKELFDDLTGKADGRLHAMRSLVDALESTSDGAMDTALDEYRGQLRIWNSSLRSHYPLITTHYGYATTLELEKEIHGGFFTAGRALELAVRLTKAGGTPPPPALAIIHRALNAQAGRLSQFYQKLADGLERRRSEIMHGKHHRYAEGHLRHFTTRDLIKALFVSDVEGFDVVRPA